MPYSQWGWGSRFGAKKPAPASSLLNNASRIVQLGDSITQYGTNLPTNLLHYQSRGELQSAHALKGNYNIDVWAADSSTNPGWWGGDMGVAGQTLTGIGNRLADAIALHPAALIIAGGTNDSITVSGGHDQLTADAYTGMATTAHNAGVGHVFLRSIWPKGPTQSTGSTVTDQRAYNADLKAFCDANPTWCHYINVFDAVTNADGTPKTGYLQADDLHPTDAGGWVAGAVVLAALEAVTDVSKSGSWLVDNFWATGNIIASGSLPGSSAVSGANYSGNLPTGWSVASYTGTAALALSLAANPDTGGQSLTIAVTSGTGGTLTINLPSLTPTVNGWYRVWAEFETDLQSVPQLQVGNAVVNDDNPVLTVKTTALNVGGTGASGKVKCMAPPIQHRGVATTPQLILTVSSSNTYNIKVHRVYMGPCLDPHVTWGQTQLPINTAPPFVTGTPGVGNVLTINPGTWSGVGSSPATTDQTYRYDRYRDGLFSTSTYAQGSLAYTQTNIDAGSVMTWRVAASNMAAGRSAAVDIAVPVSVPELAWKSQYDYVADTGITNGVADANSTAALTTVRATAGYDYNMTHLAAVDTPKRAADGLTIEPITNYYLFPTLPDNTYTRSNATITAGGGDVGPDGVTVSSRVVFSASGNIRKTIASSANYRSAKAIVKGTPGITLTLSYTPGQASTPNTTTDFVLTGGWDVIEVPNILAANSNMVWQLSGPATTFDIVYAGVGIVGTGSATAQPQTPFPLTSAAGASAADACSLMPPAGATVGVFTYDTGGKGSVTVTGGVTYNIPTTLARRVIRKFKIF